jgi:predicted phage terminase large subunit-like protein
VSTAPDYFHDIDGINAELSKRHLRHFIEQYWHVVEPATPFIGGWHIDAKCEHLEACIRGELPRLVINEPPRMSKSLTSTVMAPVWSWIEKPSLRWLCGSYHQPLSIRDARKSRQILESNYFSLQQKHWGTKISMASDQNQKQRYENTDSGYRLAISTGGAATGEGGDMIIVDDPHNVRDGESEARRKDTLEWCREVLPTRLNNRKTGAIIYIMQRVHFDDASNEALVEMGYEHLNLAMEYDPRCIVDMGHKCSLKVVVTGTEEEIDNGTSLGFKDPRTIIGDPLCPGRFDVDDIAELKHEITDYAWFSQFQQQPQSRTGGMFHASDFTIVDELPSPIKKQHRGWDKAGTKDGGARTAGVKMAFLQNGMVAVTDVVKGQWEAPERERIIKKTAMADTKVVRISIEQEPGSGGKESAQATVRNLRGFRIKVDKVSGNKILRAEPWASCLGNHDVVVLRRDWTKDFIREHAQFPRGKFKDQVDAAAQCFQFLNAKGGAHV